MNAYNIILLGAQCSGKSSLISYLKEHTNLVCIDHDEEIKRRNGGTYPSDSLYKDTVLLPQIEAYVLSLPKVIYSSSFFGLGEDGIDDARIEEAKAAGFTFILLNVEFDTLLERNSERVLAGKDDTSHNQNWYRYIYATMNEKGQFDHTLDGNVPINDVVEELINFIDLR